MAYSNKDYLQVAGKWMTIPVQINENLSSKEPVSMIVYKFSVGLDYEDNFFEYITKNISTWLKTEHGQWVIANCVSQPRFIFELNSYSFSYSVAIEAKLQRGADVWHHLKWE